MICCWWVSPALRTCSPCAPALCRFCAAFTPENRDDQWVSHLSVHLNTTRSYLSYYNEHEWLKSGFNDLKPVGIMTQRMRRWNKGESRDAPRFSCDSHNMFSALFAELKVMPSCWEWCWVVSHWRKSLLLILILITALGRMWSVIVSLNCVHAVRKALFRSDTERRDHHEIPVRESEETGELGPWTRLVVSLGYFTQVQLILCSIWGFVALYNERKHFI